VGDREQNTTTALPLCPTDAAAGVPHPVRRGDTETRRHRWVPVAADPVMAQRAWRYSLNILDAQAAYLGVHTQ
jgi:hypothetical protein